MEDVLSSPFHRELMTAKLAPGEPAFLFELPTPDGETVRIGDFTGVRPVALVFGSYT
jgi:peroxiredoxin